MGTHASIAIELEDGTIHASYVHYDGYVGGTGKILNEWYVTVPAVEKLIALGNLSYLGIHCEGREGHTFDTPVRGETVAYGRDRGEENQGPIFYDSFDEYLAMVGQEFGSSFNYLFMDGEWLVFDRKGENARNLAEILKEAEIARNARNLAEILKEAENV